MRGNVSAITNINAIKHVLPHLGKGQYTYSLTEFQLKTTTQSKIVSLNLNCAHCRTLLWPILVVFSIGDAKYNPLRTAYFVHKYFYMRCGVKLKEMEKLKALIETCTLQFNCNEWNNIILKYYSVVTTTFRQLSFIFKASCENIV